MPVGGGFSPRCDLGNGGAASRAKAPSHKDGEVRGDSDYACLVLLLRTRSPHRSNTSNIALAPASREKRGAARKLASLNFCISSLSSARFRKRIASAS